MSTVRKDFLQPVLVLLLICLVISAALAVTNEKTAPIIERTEREKAEAARREVLPDADAFTELTLTGLPEAVTAVYRADNGAGYVFMLMTGGYGGELKLICGIDADGLLTACSTLSHSETQGLGSKITAPAFSDQFKGRDAALEGVDMISGATISSKAYIGAIEAAFEAYARAKEAE